MAFVRHHILCKYVTSKSFLKPNRQDFPGIHAKHAVTSCGMLLAGWDSRFLWEVRSTSSTLSMTITHRPWGKRERGVGSLNKKYICTKAQRLYWISVQNEWNVQWIGPIFPRSEGTYLCLSYLHCTSNRERNICSSLIGAAAAIMEAAQKTCIDQKSSLLFFWCLNSNKILGMRERPHLPG